MASMRSVRSRQPGNTNACVNVLLLGCRGSGKTTLMKALTSKNGIMTSCASQHSTTNTDVFQSDVVFQSALNLKVVDTPGYQESLSNPEYIESKLSGILDKCQEKGIHFLNAICFVSKAGYTYQHDVATFERIRRRLGERFSTITLFVLTHCEALTEAKINQYKKDLINHAQTRELRNFCQLGILEFGVLDQDQLVDFDNHQRSIIKEKRLQFAFNMRDRLLQLFIECTYKVSVNENGLSTIERESFICPSQCSIS